MTTDPQDDPCRGNGYIRSLASEPEPEQDADEEDWTVEATRNYYHDIGSSPYERTRR